MRKNFAYFAIIFFIFSQISYGENIILESLKETKRVATLPFKIKSKDIYIAGRILGTGLLIYSYDGQIRHSRGVTFLLQ
ncbi:MAG: hypothetical protein K6357_06415 [Elusimicrobiota bacterium]